MAFQTVHLSLIACLVLSSFCMGSICEMRRMKWEELQTMGLAKLLDISYPIIFHSPNDPREFDALSLFTKSENLRDQFGHTKVTLSSSNAFSHGRLDSTLGMYLKTISNHSQSDSADLVDTFDALPANQVYYLFGGNYDGVWRDITNMYRVRSCGSMCEIAGAKTPGIGGENSGVSFHFHGPGFAEVIHGEKQWFFYPPDMRSILDSNFESLSTDMWKKCILPTLRTKGMSESEDCAPLLEGLSSRDLDLLSSKLQECTIYPNEILYFPPMWMHATLNLAPYNVFISTFIDPQLISGRDDL